MDLLVPSSKVCTFSNFVISYVPLCFLPLTSLMTFVSHSTFEVQPSERDLLDHIPLISEAVNRDTELAKSKVLIHFLCAQFLPESSI